MSRSALRMRTYSARLSEISGSTKPAKKSWGLGPYGLAQAVLRSGVPACPLARMVVWIPEAVGLAE